RPALAARPQLEALEDRLPPTVYTWAPTAAGTFQWATSSNWQVNGQSTNSYPHQAGDEADLTSALKGNESIDLGSNSIFIGTLQIGAASGSNTFTILASSGGNLLFSSASGPATITKTAGGADVIAASLILASRTTLTDSSSTGLTLSGTLGGFL